MEVGKQPRYMINEPGFFAQAERRVIDRASLSRIGASWATLFNIYLKRELNGERRMVQPNDDASMVGSDDSSLRISK